MSLRVISGSAKGRKLKLVPGDATRPIMDRVKEALFNILGASVVETRWLDLFAGSGSVGIEALSRGAAHCLFLDTNRQAIRTVLDNLKHTRLADQAEVRRTDAFVLLANDPRPDTQAAFDVIYVAPPQHEGMWSKALHAIDARPAWLVPDGLAIAQIDPREYEPLPLKTLELFDQRKYGNTMLCFYERPGE
jgi:16S rRNA (guanine(966)-N(2))-methyltransferase RsmD